MITVNGNSANEVFVQLCREILIDASFEVAPRGRPTRESLGAVIELFDPLNRYVTVKERNLSMVKLVGRMVWELCGHSDLASIAYYDDQALRFAGRDGVIATAYGARMMVQMPEIIATLKRDESSRRAVGVILQPHVDSVTTRLEYPCAIATHYLIRNRKLNCITYMRSESVWGVLPYDLAMFTLFQEYVAHSLGIAVGSYVHFMGSAHIYGGEIARANTVADAETEPPTAFFAGFPSIDFLRGAEAAIRVDGMLPSHEQAIVEANHASGWAQAVMLLAVDAFRRRGERCKLFERLLTPSWLDGLKGDDKHG